MASSKVLRSEHTQGCCGGGGETPGSKNAPTMFRKQSSAGFCGKIHLGFRSAGLTVQVSQLMGCGLSGKLGRSSYCI